MTAPPEGEPPDPLLVALVHALPEGAVLLDPDGRVLAHNEAAVRLAAGFDVPIVGSVLARAPAWAGSPSDDGAPTAPFVHQGPDGDSRWLRSRRLVLDDAGHVVVLVEEVTAQVRDSNDLEGSLAISRSLAGQLDRANERLATANAELQRFAGAVAHDLRAPLANVVGFADVLPDVIDGGDRAQGISVRIAHNARRAMTMVENLLDYARAVGTDGSSDTVDLDAVVAWSVETAQTALEESAGRVTWATLPKVLGNEAALRQVFGNLIDNAIRHGAGDRPPEITIRHVSSPDPELVEIRVLDNGPGIPADLLEAVFDLGVSQDTGADTASTGIGLASCRAAVRAMGGDIWAEGPRQGTGAVLVVRLPDASVFDTDVILGQFSALVVDDDPDAARLIRLVGAAAGVGAVTVAGTVAEARARYAAMESPDVVTLDLDLPDGDGIDLASWILEQRSDQKIIVFSSHADAATLDRASAAGVSMVVDKVHGDAFLEALRVLLAR